MAVPSKTPWFVPKRIGYGASPATWQGWLATAVFSLAVTVLVVRFHGPVRWALVAALSAAFILFCRAKTSAPWRWRNGSETD